MSTSIDTLAWLLAGESDPAVKQEPEYATALEQLSSDPELAARFEQEKAFSRSTDSLVSTASLPDDSRNRILAVLEKEARDQQPEPASKAAPNVIQWPSHRLLAWAAVLVFLLGGVSFISSEISQLNQQATLASYPQTHEGFRKFGASMVRDRAIRFQHRDRNVNQMVSWLGEEQGVGLQVPASVAQNKGMGCQVVKWHDRKVAILCVSQDNQTYHLFVTEAASFGEAPCPTICEETRGLKNRSWVSGDNAYLLMAHEPKQEIPEISI